MHRRSTIHPMVCFAAMAALAVSGCHAMAQNAVKENPRVWMHRVRIGAYGLKPDNGDQIVSHARNSWVYGIEVDNDITGRYGSLLHPAPELAAIQKVASDAHQAGNRAFVYVSGLECISAAGAGGHTLGKEHPDWLQRNLAGQPAIFGSSAAFWIRPGEEDAWITPYAAAWRTLYMQRIRQIAATGIDGIYVDIPYWMTHYAGWENSWASFDDDTVAVFKQRTGLDARHDIKLGDFSDPGFRKWVDFRIDSITEFLAEIRRNAIAINPKIAIIPEIFPGYGEAAVRVGADPYRIYPVVDAISHEYEFGNDKQYLAASRTPFVWSMYQIGIRTFQAFAQGKPTWMLNYSWDGEPNVKPSDAILNLAMSELMAGANVWDAKGHVMSGSNDMPTRTAIFRWVADHEDVFSAPRTPMGMVGVYFSERTRNYYAKDFVLSYRGALLLLERRHIQFQIVTPRTLASFHGSTLILPDVHLLAPAEESSLRSFSSGGGKLILTGHSITLLPGLAKTARFPDDPGTRYYKAAEANFEQASLDAESKFFEAIDDRLKISVQAPPDLVVNIARVHGQPHLFFANFQGLRSGTVATPAPVENVRVVAPLADGATLHLLPFMGASTVLQGTPAGESVQFTIPKIDRGMVAWITH